MVTKAVPYLPILTISNMAASSGVSWRELGIQTVLLISIPSEMRDNLLSLRALKVILSGLTQLSGL